MFFLQYGHWPSNSTVLFMQWLRPWVLFFFGNCSDCNSNDGRASRSIFYTIPFQMSEFMDKAENTQEGIETICVPNK